MSESVKNEGKGHVSTQTWPTLRFKTEPNERPQQPVILGYMCGHLAGHLRQADRETIKRERRLDAESPT